MVCLIDGNNFYVSCERVFNPRLEGRAVIVLSNNDGCVVSRSNEAKALGIPMAAPLHEIAELVYRHGVLVFSSNYNLYGDLSRRMMSVLARLAPAAEVYSIDEAFLDFRDLPCSDWRALGLSLRVEVLRQVGIPTGVGLAPTKALAKVANRMAKKQPGSGGVWVLERPADIEAALRVLPVADVWGIGSRYSRLLESRGVHTAWDFTQLPPEWVRRQMTVVGLRLWEELRGRPCLPLEAVQPKQHICTSRSFGRMLDTFPAVRAAVATYAHRCACKLRKQGSAANLLTVFLHTNPFRPDLPQYNPVWTGRLPAATDSSLTLVQEAVKALETLWRDGYRYKKAGVIVGGIVPADQVQLNLLENNPEAREKQRRLMGALDCLRARHGHDSVLLGAQYDTDPGRQLRQQRLSRRFTTNWEELLWVRGG